MKPMRLFLILCLVVHGVLMHSGTSRAGDSALRRLDAVRIFVNGYRTSEPASVRFQNAVEKKLRQAGLNVHPDAVPELRVNVSTFDISPDERIIGKYGTVHLSLHEPVKLARDTGTATSACTWQGNVVIIHGPADTFAERLLQLSLDLTGDFLGKWKRAQVR